MPRLSFTLRDVFWLTLAALLGFGWWNQSRQFRSERHRLEMEVFGFRSALEGDGWQIREDGDEIIGKRKAVANEHGQWFLNFKFGPSTNFTIGSSVEKPGLSDDGGTWKSYPDLSTDGK
jgi:hypothetical protein